MNESHRALRTSRQSHPGGNLEQVRHETRRSSRCSIFRLRSPSSSLPRRLPPRQTWDRMLIAYCDDVHLLCPPAVANEILLLLAAPASDLLPIAPATHIQDPSFISVGLELSQGKQSIFSPSFSDPATRVRASSILRPAIRLLGDPRLPSFQDKADAILRGDGSTIASCRH